MNMESENNMQVLSLFPVPVALFNIGREFTKKELSFVNEAETRPNMGNTTSIDNYILQNKELKKIGEFIQSCLNTYFKAIYQPKEEEVSIEITQSWLNYTKQGQFHHKHAHPNSLISGVFYLSSDEADKIFFHRGGYSRIKIDPKDWNLFNSESWWLEATTGKLIVFPSELEHMVEQVQTDHTRISLSFNTFPKGIVGTNHSLTELKVL